MRNKILLAVAVGILILIGSSIGSAVLIETGVVGGLVESLRFKQQAPAQGGMFPKLDNGDIHWRGWRKQQEFDRQYECLRLEKQRKDECFCADVPMEH